MSARSPQLEPFVRGCTHDASGSVPYPRLPPGDADQLPGDVWQAAGLPALVRLELVGDASAVRVRYRTTTGNLGYRGDAAGCSFVVFRSGRKVAEVPAELGESEVTLDLPGDPDQPAIVYLPEGMRPVVTQLQPVGGGLRPAPRQPRCLVVGDHVTQGWLAASPATSWPAIVGRKLGLDVVNLGFAGTTRLEAAVAQAVATTPAEAVVVSVGTGCWSRPPHSAALLAESLRGFLDLVRAGHHDTPLVVVSPLLRPAAEDVPNVFGATLGDLRRVVEDVVMERIPADPALALVPGQAILTEDDLADGVYPGDEGHRRVAAAVGKWLTPRMADLRQAALSRWQEEILATSPAFAGQLVVPAVAGPTGARPARTGPTGAEPARTRPTVATVPAPGAHPPVPPTGAGRDPRPGGGDGQVTADGSPAAPVGTAPSPPGSGGPGDPRRDAGGEPFPVPEAVAAAARASAAAARAYAETTGRVVAATG